MRFLWIALIVLFALAGAVFGAFNSDDIALDFYLFKTDVPKGAALLSALLTGWLGGGIVIWLAVVLPLQRKLSRSRREAARREPVPAQLAAGMAGDA